MRSNSFFRSASAFGRAEVVGVPLVHISYRFRCSIP